MRHYIFVVFLLALAFACAGDESLTGNFSAAISHDFKSVLGSKTIRDTGATGLSQGFSFGTSTSAAQINAYHAAEYRVASDSEVGISFTQLTDLSGADIAITTPKAVIIRNLSTSATVTAGKASEPLSFVPGPILLPPGGCLAMTSPLSGWDTATASTIYLSCDAVASCEVSILGIAE